MKKLLVSVQILLISILTWGGQSMLTQECNVDNIPQIFVEGHSWVDFPKYDNRKFWNNVNQSVKANLISRGEEAAKSEPVALTGYDYLLFRQGESYDVVSQKILTKKSRLEDLMMAEIVEGKGRFIEDICSSVWDFCALSHWTGPESHYLQTGKLGLPSLDKQVVDELTGEIAGILSWAYYFFESEFNKVDPNITTWLLTSVRTKFLNPNESKTDFYWMDFYLKGVSYQTPWISYNWLLSELLIEKDNSKRQKSIYKALECLDQFYKKIPSDGACTGGAEIWQYSTAKYFQSLELLEMVSIGEIDIYSDELLKKMGEYICATHISDNYFFSYSECSPELVLPASLIYRYGEKVDSDMMKGYAAYLAQQQKQKGYPVSGDLFNKIKYVVDYDKILNIEAKEPLLADYSFNESQIVIARSKEGSKEGFYFGVKGGDNNEFGNQNDAGNFILYANGKPLIVDPGSIEKTAKSIDKNRYSIWANQSAWHNLPTVNGQMQKDGSNFRATGMEHSSNGSQVTVSMNLVYAYDLSAGIDSWTRTYNFNRSSGLEISDRFSLNKVEGETFVSFIAFSKPQIKKNGLVSFKVEGQEYEFEYKSSFTLSVEEINTSESPELKEWGSNLYRLVLKPNSQERSGNWTYSFRKV